MPVFARTFRVATRAATFGSLLAMAAMAVAADPPQAAKLTELVRTGRLHFDMVLGRINAWSQSGGGYSSESSSNDRREKLTVHNAGASLTIKYELTTPAETLTIEASNPSYLQIQRAPVGQSDVVPVQFTQAPGKPVTLTVGQEGAKRVYQAPSFWHLLLVEPDATRTHLVPLLQVLQPNTDLAKAVAELERELLTLADEEGLPDRQRWDELVAQLGEDRFSRRQNADRALRQAGPLAMIYLRSLDPSTLDAEQRFRIRRILASQTSGSDADNPRDIARWLAGDSQVWLSLLERPDLSTRRVAFRWLTWMLGEPPEFDPAADADTRRAQIERLRRAMGGQASSD